MSKKYNWIQRIDIGYQKHENENNANDGWFIIVMGLWTLMNKYDGWAICVEANTLDALMTNRNFSIESYKTFSDNSTDDYDNCIKVLLAGITYLGNCQGSKEIGFEV